MLLVHQAGSVKVGEVVRYTVTYTPSADRILPTPTHLFVRIKNTSAVPLRAAYLRGPYTLHVCTYPSTFNPNQKVQSPRRDGVPEFEPNLKAGGHWHAKLTVPEEIREKGDMANNTDAAPEKMTWIIEIASQILFSNTASVHYELLVGRDERSLELGFAAVASKGHGEPGQIADFKKREESTSRQHSTQPKGVYSRAVDLLVEDTAALWNKPTLPQWGDQESQLPTDEQSSKNKRDTDGEPSSGIKRSQKQKKLHLVILTHGLHSNIGADMLYVKESIDAAARKAREAARASRREARKNGKSQSAGEKNQDESTSGKNEESQANAPAPVSGGQDQMSDDENDEDADASDDEQVIVRGFAGNACRTDRGVQYLGKRLAKFVLTTTYPDQPFLPTTKSRTFSGAFLGNNNNNKTNKYGGTPAHHGSSIQRKDSKEKLPYTFTKISFIGHSLGGLVQTYAVAYIHKHSPGFFKKIEPQNFVAMASPLLGLSNENPLYVKFALDFGLVGRTGQDLGLTWRAPNIARTGWSAMISGFSNNGGQQQETKQQDPRAKPLLRILPTGPAHEVLKMFRNRTLYSNVVNDGIVPLRTSCLLFLDWHGLDKVDNARRENGLIGTMAAFGWAELTGANAGPARSSSGSADGDLQSIGSDNKSTSNAPDEESESKSNTLRRADTDVPQPTDDQSQDMNRIPSEPSHRQFLSRLNKDDATRSNSDSPSQDSFGSESEDSSRFYTLPNNPLTDFINFFRPASMRAASPKPRKMSNKAAKTYKRAQTIKRNEEEKANQIQQEESSKQEARSETKRPLASRGDSMAEDPNRMPPPKTSIFDSASDILNPPLAPQSWLIDPTKRSRTIFHDRIYHPEDIPPPPNKRPRTSTMSFSSTRSESSQDSQRPAEDGLVMKVEEKIARAYHKDMSWRKVLVRLEPDAHNNMVVRRIFANAYGWDVVKHLCDTHFADTYASNTRDEHEAGVDRAMPMDDPVTEDAEEVKGQTETTAPAPPREIHRTLSEEEEATDRVSGLERPRLDINTLASSYGSGKIRELRSPDSVVWTDEVFDDGDDADDTEDEHAGPFETFQRMWAGNSKEGKHQSPNAQPTSPQSQKDSNPTITDVMTREPENLVSHRGIGVIQAQPSDATHSTFQSAGLETLMAEDAKPSEIHGSTTSPAPL